MKYSVKIPSREALKYASNGYFVIQNTAMGHVQVNADGLHIEMGQTIAIIEFTEFCKKAMERGLIRVIARPNESDPSKKPKKRSEDVISTVEQRQDTQPMPIEASENNAIDQSPTSPVETVENISETIKQDDASGQE